MPGGRTVSTTMTSPPSLIIMASAKQNVRNWLRMARSALAAMSLFDSEEQAQTRRACFPRTTCRSREDAFFSSANGAVFAKERRGGNSIQRLQAPIAPVLVHDGDLMRQRCVDLLDAVALHLLQIGSGRPVRRHDQRGGRHHVCDRPASRLIVDHLDDLAAIVQTAGRA